MNIFWQDIVGHKRIIERLRRMFRNNRLPHALLFSGSSGIGKKAVARVSAALLLCSAPVLDKPCGKCKSCRLMAAGTHPDFTEILPEGRTLKSIRIEKIRELKETAARYPVIAARRVMIIDDAHLMNEPASNALLKTIEEPVGSVNFILVTSAAGALLDTILSRCTQINFFPLETNEVADVLRRFDYADADAQKLAGIAEGSVSRAMEMGKGDGTAIYEDAVKFLVRLDKMQLDEIFAKGEELSKMPKERVRDWFMHLNALLRDLLVLNVGGAPNSAGKELDVLVDTVAHFTKEQVFAMQSIVDEILQQISANVNLRLFVESGLIRLRELINCKRW